MKTALILIVAGTCCASTVSLDSLKHVEASINDRFKSEINDPYDLMGTARGTYLPGYGVAFTIEMNLITVPQLMGTPFSPAPRAAELLKLHLRKLKKLDELRGTMRSLMIDASKALPELAPQENIMFEAFLFNWRWEDASDVPHRLMLAVNKQKLTDALNHHADDAELQTLFEERKL